MKYIFFLLTIFGSFQTSLFSNSIDLDNTYPTPKKLTNIYEKAYPSVVTVKIYYDSTKDKNASWLYDFIFGSTYEYRGHGSGFFLTSDGYIIINAHVARAGNCFNVILSDGEEIEGILIGKDDRSEVAVLKIEKEDIPTLPLSDCCDLQIGEWVLAIGSPVYTNLNSSLSIGVIGGLNRQGLNYIKIEDFIQLDINTNAGNSGGPILNLSGEVIGIDTIGFKSWHATGISFAVPSNIVKAISDQLIKNGKILKSRCGIYLKTDEDKNILVSSTVYRSPARKAGLLKDDIIVEYNNIKATTIQSFINYILLLVPNDTLNLTVERDEELISFELVMQEVKK